MNWETEFRSFKLEELEVYDNRPGFDLVSCQKVGLPVYKITIDALTQVHKPIPPIEEYVLKTIDIGFSSEAEIADFLGLELATIREAMINLRISEDIDLVADDVSQLQKWKLTKKGEKTLQDAKILVPEERTFEINFDGLLQIPRWYGSLENTLLKPKVLRDEGFIEIEPSRNSPPELSDLKLKDIDAIIRSIENDRRKISRKSQEVDLLALKAIQKKPRFFQPAMALVYQAKESDEIQITFVIDRRVSSEHETALTRSKSFKKIQNKILNALQENNPRQFAEELFGLDFVKKNLANPDDFVTTKVRETQVEIKAQIESTQEQIEQTDNEDEKKNLTQQLQEKKDEISKLQAEKNAMLASLPMRWLEMYEHRPLLEEALKDSQDLLMIISPWIRVNVVDKLFLEKLENLLGQKVQVFIGYGLGKKDEKADQQDVKAKESLQNLSKKYSENFTLKKLGDTHAKILISDTKFAVTTSFNWLSFKGERDRTFRDERGTLVSDVQKINELFDNLLKRFI